jgi:hypothetical protein
MDFAAGTRFYLENLKRYAVVEDLCGDGPTPERGPCHIGYLNHPWIDIYIGAQSLNEVKATSCANKITGLQPVIMNPADNLPVSAGEIALTAC